MSSHDEGGEAAEGLSRRRLLQAGATAAAGVALAPRVTRASTSDERYIVDMSTTSMGAMGDVDVVYDFREEIGYAVVEGGESDLPGAAAYAPDLEIEIETPQQDRMEESAEGMEEPLADLQWDKQEQDVQRVHEDATGDGARIGVVDDGVLGAGDRTVVGGLEGHPDLPDVRGDLSVNFTADGNGPGPLNDDHGTHCAGTAAAAANGTGVIGVAPDAEVVDLRVFSGAGASFADVGAAVVVGAAPEGVPVGTPSPASSGQQVFEGAGCDVLNLSLGSPPLVPVEGFDPENPPSVPAPYVPASASEVAVLEGFVSATGSFAVDNGSLPVASAGNSAVNLDEPIEVPDVGRVAPVVLPAEAEGFMSVGAAGPIGFGWPLEPRSEEVAPGLEIEAPIRTGLPTEEPANYTNYGADGVDVTAGGGNFDADAFAAGVTEARYDLVFNTGIANLLPTDPDGDGEIENPENLVLEEYVPGYVFKAGTSFAAPNVAGLAALLFAAGEDATPGEVRSAIEDTAKPLPVGRAAETTAPVLPTDQVNLDTDNEATDGDFDGDKPSSPGRNPGRFDPATFRGEGHIDVAAAVRRIRGGEDGEDGDGPPGQGRGRGRGN